MILLRIHTADELFNARNLWSNREEMFQVSGLGLLLDGDFDSLG
jgi:hypothetical protein